jgi:hypothetical protein
MCYWKVSNDRACLSEARLRYAFIVRRTKWELEAALQSQVSARARLKIESSIDLSFGKFNHTTYMLSH